MHQIYQRPDEKMVRRSYRIKEENNEIDHVRAIIKRGTNKNEKLLPLCQGCHLVDKSNEHETGHHIKIDDSETSFHENVQEIIDGPFCRTRSFVENAYFKPAQEDL